jgi:hypothetical protein
MWEAARPLGRRLEVARRASASHFETFLETANFYMLMW